MWWDKDMYDKRIHLGIKFSYNVGEWVNSVRNAFAYPHLVTPYLPLLSP
jgi:hypothetical protein